MIFYRKYRNIYNNLVRQAKSNYYSKRLRDSSHDIKKTWSVLQEIIGKTKTKCSLPTKLNVTNKDFFSLHLEDPIQIADYFNSFFASVGERTSICIDIDPNIDPMDFLNDISINESFFLSPTDIKEVIATALAIKSKSSTGFDGISNFLTKNIIHSIAEPLTHIYNLSFSTGTIPDLYKIAKIIPIYKSGDKFDVANYRPISLLPAFSKILEKLMSKRLLNFIIQHDLIHPGQYGFIKGRSTEHAMLGIPYKIILNRN